MVLVIILWSVHYVESRVIKFDYFSFVKFYTEKDTVALHHP